LLLSFETLRPGFEGLQTVFETSQQVWNVPRNCGNVPEVRSIIKNMVAIYQKTVLRRKYMPTTIPQDNNGRLAWALNFENKFPTLAPSLGFADTEAKSFCVI
jgi:hypothetical protein